MKAEIGRDDVVRMAAQTQCAVCKTPYGRSGVQLLGRRGRAWVIAVTCSHCEAEGLIVATVDDAEVGSMRIAPEPAARPKIMYDVTYEEWLAFQERPPVSHDDVLDIHLFLKDFDGDFERLFATEPVREDAMK